MQFNYRLVFIFLIIAFLFIIYLDFTKLKGNCLYHNIKIGASIYLSDNNYDYYHGRKLICSGRYKTDKTRITFYDWEDDTSFYFLEEKPIKGIVSVQFSSHCIIFEPDDYSYNFCLDACNDIINTRE